MIFYTLPPLSSIFLHTDPSQLDFFTHCPLSARFFTQCPLSVRFFIQWVRPVSMGTCGGFTKLSDTCGLWATSAYSARHCRHRQHHHPVLLLIALEDCGYMACSQGFAQAGGGSCLPPLHSHSLEEVGLICDGALIAYLWLRGMAHPGPSKIASSLYYGGRQCCLRGVLEACWNHGSGGCRGARGGCWVGW